MQKSISKHTIHCTWSQMCYSSSRRWHWVSFLPNQLRPGTWDYIKKTNKQNPPKHFLVWWVSTATFRMAVWTDDFALYFLQCVSEFRVNNVKALIHPVPCGRTGDSNHGWREWQLCSNCVILSGQYKSESWRNVSTHCWTCATKN